MATRDHTADGDEFTPAPRTLTPISHSTGIDPDVPGFLATVERLRADGEAEEFKPETIRIAANGISDATA